MALNYTSMSTLNNDFSAMMLMVGTLSTVSPTTSFLNLRQTVDSKMCRPLIVGHRGACGYVPENTLGAFALAVTMGADYIDLDLVMSKDGHLIVRHENELSLSTNVAQHPEFVDRYRNQTVDGVEKSGWFSENFTLQELKTLRATEPIPKIRPGNARMNGSFDIPTFQEVIDLIKGLQISQSRAIGIYPEIKHSTHFRRIGLSMEKPLVRILRQNGYYDYSAPVYIQSLEITNLKELRKMTSLRLVQLFETDKTLIPFDQVLLGTGLTYADMATRRGLKEIATYADAVGPDKIYIIPRNADSILSAPTSFVKDAHALNLEVHPYTFYSENVYLPKEFQTNDTSEAAIGVPYVTSKAK